MNEDCSKDLGASYEDHPLFPIFIAALQQCMHGKGERHGGNVTPFMEQPWVHYAAMHGRGFLTGQAAKKLEEAASTRSGKAFEQEVLGAIVYCGMAIISERMKPAVSGLAIGEAQWGIVQSGSGGSGGKSL